MPTYVLEGGSGATLPAKPLVLRVQGPGESEARLEARQDVTPDPTAMSPQPGVLVLPRVTGPVDVRVIPAGGRPFPSGTVIALSAAIEQHGDPDPERAVMLGVDLSGLTGRELLRIEPRDGQVRLTALGVVVDSPLPALAAKARDIARELLGVEWVPDSDASALVIRVDGSASMRSLVADGSVGAALEVLAGISRVTSADLPVTAEAGSPNPTVVQADSVGALPLEVHQALSALPLLTGFRSAGRVGGAGRTSLCVGSDSVPADLPVDVPVALAVIASPQAREVIAPRAPAGTGWIPVGERGERSAYAWLSEDQLALREAVRGLLRAIIPPGSGLRPQLDESGNDIDGGADQTLLRARFR